MPKPIVQDVIVPSHSPRDIANDQPDTIKERRGTRADFFDQINKEILPRRNAPYRAVSPQGEPAKRGQRFAIWAVAAAAVLSLSFAVLSFFSGAIIEIVPLQKSVTVDGDFTAKKEAQEGELPFKLVELENSVTDKVAVTGEKEIERKASGTIVIYNTYSSASQKLIARTRFETSDGKVYRSDRSITVPGTKMEDGKTIPGSVEVAISADIPGKEYNIELTDFTIPGFKGDPRYSKFYARSKTPMEGGIAGTVKTASTEDIAGIKTKLQNSIKETLLAQVRSQVPDDFILYDDAVFFVFESSDEVPYTTESNIEVKEKGTLYGVLFNKSDLSKHLAKKTISTYDGGDILADNPERLIFNVKDREAFDPAKAQELSFTLKGNALFIWGVDEKALAADLAGKNKDDFLGIINQYSNIQEAEATLRPFWRKTFPLDGGDITIRKRK